MALTARLVATLAALALAGCTQVTDNELRPGQYEITLGGDVADLAVPGAPSHADSLPRQICISGEPKAFAAQLIAPLMKLNEQCDEAALQRTGAHVTAIALCPLDPARAQGSSVTMQLAGDISAAGLEAELGTRWSLGAGADPALVDAANRMQSAKLRISAKYTGVCEAASEPPRRKPSRALPLRDETVAEDTSAQDTSFQEAAPEATETEDVIDIEIADQ